MGNCSSKRNYPEETVNQPSSTNEPPDVELSRVLMGDFDALPKKCPNVVQIFLCSTASGRIGCLSFLTLISFISSSFI